jgi:hypothetical protein
MEGESFQDRKKLSPLRSFEPITICRCTSARSSNWTSMPS